MQILDLSTKPRIKGAKHWFQDLNQLYHPTGEFEQDTHNLGENGQIFKTNFIL